MSETCVSDIFCVEKQNGRGPQAGLFPGAADDFRHFRRKRENNSAGIGSAVVDTGLDGTVAYNGPARAGGGGTAGRRPSGGNARTALSLDNSRGSRYIMSYEEGDWESS